MLEDLRSYWRDHHAEARYAGVRIHVLRNPPRSGIGFYRGSGFYPDFLLWVHRTDGSRRVVFLEPHGMEYESGLGCDKLRAMLDLRALSAAPAFEAARIGLDGYLLTETPLDRIPGAPGKHWKALAGDHALIHLDPPDVDRSRQAAQWVERVLGGG